MDFGELYEKHFDKVYAYARCRLGTDAAAEDACSEIFAKALRSLDQYDASRGEPVQWLFGIARNEVNYALRRAALIAFLPLDLFGDIFRDKGRESTPAGAQAADELGAALAGLDEKERELVTLKFYSELNNRQIAAMTGLGESNVGTILWRAMAKLRKIMGVERA